MPDQAAAADPTTELAWLRRPQAIRERAEQLYGLALRGELEHFSVDTTRLDGVTERVLAETRARYPDLRRIPYHGRYRHFGPERLARLERALAGLSREAALAARFELVITSVLLDAGAGEGWSYRDGGGSVSSRSEGLALASFDWFAAGGLSSSGEPYGADAARLRSLELPAFTAAFQVHAENPLAGLEGRLSLLRELGAAVERRSDLFGTPPRLGGLGASLLKRARAGELEAPELLSVLLDALGPIWPGRERLLGQPLGDVFRHSAVGRVPFHKLSQWLAYSLCEPLEAAGVRVVRLNELTGLAEYRNGGLFVDGGVLVPKDAGATTRAHAVGSELVVEWRALTLALLDRVAAGLQQRTSLTPQELPLARVLEGGTWWTGRALARERRGDGSPPLRVLSDGTVF